MINTNTDVINKKAKMMDITNTSVIVKKKIINTNKKMINKEGEAMINMKTKVLSVNMRTCMAKTKAIKKKRRNKDLQQHEGDQQEHKHDHKEENN